MAFQNQLNQKKKIDYQTYTTFYRVALPLDVKILLIYFGCQFIFLRHPKQQVLPRRDYLKLTCILQHKYLSINSLEYLSIYLFSIYVSIFLCIYQGWKGITYLSLNAVLTWNTLHKVVRFLVCPLSKPLKLFPFLQYFSSFTPNSNTELLGARDPNDMMTTEPKNEVLGPLFQLYVKFNFLLPSLWESKFYCIITMASWCSQKKVLRSSIRNQSPLKKIFLLA